MLNFLRAQHKQQHRLAIALTNTSVTLVVTTGSDAQPELRVSDTQVVENEQFASVIKQLFNTYQRFIKTASDVIIVLGAELYQSVAVDRPQLKADEISASLKYSLRDLVSYPSEQLLADYYDLPVQLPNQDKIVAVATDKRYVLELLSLLHEAKLAVRGIFAEEQVLSCLFAQAAKPCVVVHQAQQAPALLQVYKNGKLQVNRVVRGLSKLSELERDEIKLGALQPLVVEIQRSADYFERQLRQTPIEKVQLACQLADQTAAIEQIMNDLGYSATFAEYPAWAQELSAGDYSDFPALAGACLLHHELVGETTEAAEEVA